MKVAFFALEGSTMNMRNNGYPYKGSRSVEGGPRLLPPLIMHTLLTWIILFISPPFVGIALWCLLTRKLDVYLMYGVFFNSLYPRLEWMRLTSLSWADCLFDIRFVQYFFKTRWINEWDQSFALTCWALVGEIHRVNNQRKNYWWDVGSFGMWSWHGNYLAPLKCSRYW